LKDYLNDPDYDHKFSFSNLMMKLIGANGKIDAWVEEISEYIKENFNAKLDEIDNNDNLDEDQKREFMFNEFIATYDNGI